MWALCIYLGMNPWWGGGTLILIIKKLVEWLHFLIWDVRSDTLPLLFCMFHFLGFSLNIWLCWICQIEVTWSSCPTLENAIIQPIYHILNEWGKMKFPIVKKYFLHFKNPMSTINPYLISPLHFTPIQTNV